MAEKIGLSEAIAMAVGGMVGGGIFAVSGVVAVEAGPSAWLAFIASGLIAASAGYSFVRLNDLLSEPGSPITMIEAFTGRTDLAGMMRWTFVIGYIGTMGLYAYAFGSYFVALFGINTVTGLSAQPLISAIVVLVFVGINATGAHASGRTEDALVGLKVLILLLFCFGGIYYEFTHGELQSGLASLGTGPLIAAALSFVAFEGWELLLFDQESIRDPRQTVSKAVFVSIAGVTVLYVLVAIVTTSLVSATVIQANSETALAIAAAPFLGQLGFSLISIAALFSTASALNATLFSTSRLMNQLATEQLLPRRLESHGGDPVRELVILGVLTASLATLGSLNAISSFASLAFIVIFGLVSALAYRKHSDAATSTVVPIVGTGGAIATVLALVWYLAVIEPGTFVVVVFLTVLVILMELFYFERIPIEEEIESLA
ncbi:putative fructoselysine transporter [Halalkalicoccus paucihalophilus]|uniref:Putative fructoselysine transporter n=1 Tax=Halalkalicoccus paucihalophilus TaxID=1008153 RepID=A0A151A9E0_9EURY|nr:APC family permease [Halalkalicoccus paucihalophilus]KYH24223.1 putative fructoselysine transporter [Halalkalicoccus paucihalophilus]